MEIIRQSQSEDPSLGDRSGATLPHDGSRSRDEHGREDDYESETNRRGCRTELGTPDSPGLWCYHRCMNGQEIIARLRENEPALRARGVSHAALFGSRARRQPARQRHRHHGRI